MAATFDFYLFTFHRIYFLDILQTQENKESSLDTSDFACISVLVHSMYIQSF